MHVTVSHGEGKSKAYLTPAKVTGTNKTQSLNLKSKEILKTDRVREPNKIYNAIICHAFEFIWYRRFREILLFVISCIFTHSRLIIAMRNK